MCVQCKVEKPLVDFNKRYDRFGVRTECRVCEKEYQKKYQKEYRQNNKGKDKERISQWQKEHRERRNASYLKWYTNNPEKRNTVRERLNHNVSSLMNFSLKGNKNGSHWESLIDYTVDQLKKHLEKRFKPGMNWDNYGKWHIDHKIPISKFNFTSSEHIDFKRCWGLKNLQPLWAIENIKKKDKLDKHFQPALLL